MISFTDISNFINSEISKVDWIKEPVGLYEPISYTMTQGGKRVRPALMLMAYNLYRDDIEKIINPAIGIEVFHNFTLLHDDIMDKASIRRGKPTVHLKWDENTAILSGDVMQILAYEYISDVPAQYLKEVLKLFTKTAAEICEGQQYDMEFESRVDVNPDEYLEMIRLKTAVLLGCSLQIGAILGGSSQKDAESLYAFGVNLGLAFQLKDDILDVYGEEATFGKQIGGDIFSNKKTFLLIHAKNRAKDDILKNLEFWLNKENPDRESKINEVTKIYNQLEVKNICEEAMNSYYKKAIAKIDLVNVSQIKKQELRKLAEKLLHRNE